MCVIGYWLVPRGKLDCRMLKSHDNFNCTCESPRFGFSQRTPAAFCLHVTTCWSGAFSRGRLCSVLGPLLGGVLGELRAQGARAEEGSARGHGCTVGASSPGWGPAPGSQRGDGRMPTGSRTDCLCVPTLPYLPAAAGAGF